MVEEGEYRLIELALSGDQQAFDELWKRNVRSVQNTAWGILKESNDVSDIVQKVFQKAFGSLKGFSGRSKFSTWLHRITVNKCLDHLREKHNRTLREVELESLPAEKNVFSGFVSRLHEEDRRELGAEVRARVLGDMEERKAEVVRLVLDEGCKAGEVTMKIGVEQSTVREIMKEFRKKYRQTLQTLKDPWIARQKVLTAGTPSRRLSHPCPGTALGPPKRS